MKPEKAQGLEQTTETLLAEGDRLARQLAQVLPVTTQDAARLTLLGRSLVSNLLGALLPTLEQISRHSHKPRQARLTHDERGRAVLEVVKEIDQQVTLRLPIDDLLAEMLYVRGKLHPAVLADLRDALSGDEHHATRALVRCLRSRPVMEGLQKVVRQALEA